ncbi:MAG: hypothetical protein ABI409_09440, partial [Ramlibacter sp.]
LAALGPAPWKWLPWRPMSASLAALLLLAALQAGVGRAASLPAGLALAALFAALVVGSTWAASAELRKALRQ